MEILEHIANGIHLLDGNLNFIYLNKEAESFWGRKKSDLLGKHIWAEIPGKYTAMLYQQLNNALNSKIAVKHQVYSHELNSWIEIYIAPSCNGLMMHTKRVATAKDKMHVERLCDNPVEMPLLNTVLKANNFNPELGNWKFLDRATVGIHWVSKDGSTLYVNKTELDLLGYSREEWMQVPAFWYSIICAEDREAVCCEINRIWEDKKSRQMQFRCVKKNGGILWMESHAVIVSDEQGKAVGLKCININITRLKELEEKKDEFIGVASHELRTPLTSIKAYIQLLERIIDESQLEVAKSYVKKTSKHVSRLSVLISDLFDVLKIQSGKLQYQKDEFCFQDVIKESVDHMQTLTDKHHIFIEGEANMMVQGDRLRLEQVVNNYLSNAVKYSPGSDKIIVRVCGDKENIQVSVKDFGIGIAKEKLSRIFERFYRVEELPHQFSGLGIGLFIAHEIIKRHGGRTWVESELGKGSVFHFVLPVKMEILPEHDEKTSILLMKYLNIIRKN